MTDHDTLDILANDVPSTVILLGGAQILVLEPSSPGLVTERRAAVQAVGRACQLRGRRRDVRIRNPRREIA